jgi:3-methyl-2-oxobutanoate hydroxymethyltransferase
MSTQPQTHRFTLTDLVHLHQTGEKLVMLTCYDASFAALSEAAGVELLLIGDSLGNVVQGQDSTLPVTLEHIRYHTAAVKRGSSRAMIIADLPFGASQISPEETFRNVVPLMAAGAQMVKLEGGEDMAATVRFLVSRGVPVCGHIGLTPQSVHQLGGFRVQGKDDKAAERLLSDALALEVAGAAMIVLEAIPASLAERITETLRIPTIGIGAGAGASGQVLVVYDMLDISPGKKPRFVKNFMANATSIQEAVATYVREVKAGLFPDAEYSY